MNTPTIISKIAKKKNSIPKVAEKITKPIDSKLTIFLALGEDAHKGEAIGPWLIARPTGSTAIPITTPINA